MSEFNRLTADDDLEEGLAEEVAIVPRGAVGRTIAFRKEHPMKIADILKACADVPLENEAKLDKVLKEAGLDGEALDAAKAIARLASAYSDKLPAEALVKALNASVSKAGPEGEEYEYGKPKAKAKAEHEDEMDEEEKAKAKKFGAALKTLAKSRGMTAAKLAQETEEEEEEMHKLLKGAKRATSKQLTKIARALGVKVAELKKEAPMPQDPKNSPSAVLARILKGDSEVDLSVIQDPETRAAFQIFKAEQETKDAELVQIRKDLGAETDRRVMKELTEEVEKKYSHLPGAKVEEIAKSLKELRTKAPEAAAEMEKLLASSDEAIRKGAAFAELTGDAYHTGAAANAISRVEMAADAILKSGEKNENGKALTKDQAIDLAITRDPKLYSEYVEEAGISDFHSKH